MKPFGFTLLVTALILCFVLGLSSAGWGTTYAKGRYSCSKFEEVEKLYKKTNLGEDIDLEINYAACLILRGQGNDAAEGMRHLHRVLDMHGHVFAALFIAEYIESGGDFEIPIDMNKINEAVQAYYKVLAIINREPSYPYRLVDYTGYEFGNQIELRAHYHVPYLYINKFWAGFNGLYREHLYTSPSYKGKRDLPRFHKYSSYTRDSLKKTIESANRCLALPQKRHFKPKHYEYYQKQCGLLKEAAIGLRPLEDKRLVLLATESCRRDLPKCREYNELHKWIKDIIKQLSSKRKAVSKSYDIGLL